MRLLASMAAMLALLPLLACTPAGQPTRQPDATLTPTTATTAATARVDPTRSPAPTPISSPVRQVTPTSQRPAATGVPTFSPVTPTPISSGSPIVAGANRPAVLGQCHDLATANGVAIVEVSSTPGPRPAPAYRPVPVRPASSGAINLLPDSSGNLPGLDVHSVHGKIGSGPLDVKAPAFVDWTIRNAGPDPAPAGYVTDLYLDDVFVSRWQGVSLPRGGSAGIRDWAGITEAVRISPGRHVVRLVIDATNQIAETDESDNVIEIELEWNGEAAERKPASRLPDFAIVSGPGGAPIVVSNDPAATIGQNPSADYVTYLSWSIENAGLASTGDRVPIHLYFDGVFVTSRIAEGIVASGISVVDAWEGLIDVVKVSPGEHTLKVVVDPGDLIPELNEDNNVREMRVTWSTGLPPARSAEVPVTSLSARRQVLSAPNLKPVIPRGWDGPVVVGESGLDGHDEGHEAPVAAGKPWNIKFAVTNASPVSTGASFEVVVSVDGKRIGSERFRGGTDDSGGLWTGSMQVNGGQFNAGPHTIAIEIDPAGAVGDRNRSDNRCERSVTLLAQLPPAPADVRYGREALKELTAALPALLLEIENLGARTPGSEAKFNQVMRVAEAANFFLSGRSLRDDRLEVSLLPRNEYDRATLRACVARADALRQSELDDLLARCTTERVREAGLQTVDHGRVVVFVDTDRSTPAVLSTLFHELGHARQALLSVPEPGEGLPAQAARALHEAQAQIYEAAMWRSIEQFSGVRPGEYPDHVAMRKHLVQLQDEVIEGASAGEVHDLGYVLLWLHALKDPDARGFAAELRSAGRLSAASTLRLYEDLLAISDPEATAWANRLLERSQPLIDEFLAISSGRLVKGLAYEDEAHPALIEAFLIAP